MATWKFKPFEDNDIVEGNQKTKYFPAWSDVSSDADLTQTAIMMTFYSSSIQVDSIEGRYYWNMYIEDPGSILDAESQFSVAYGHTASLVSGKPKGVYSAVMPSTLGVGTEYSSSYQAWAIYRQMVNAIGSPDDSSHSNLTYVSGTTTYTMDDIYVIALNRARIKDYIDPNTWNFLLAYYPRSASIYAAPTTEGSSQREYNVLMSLSGPSIVTNVQDCGRFYADRGLIILDAKLLHLAGVVSGTSPLSVGQVTTAYADGNKYYKPDLIFKNFCSQSLFSGSHFQARSIEKVQSTHYFVRARNYEFNYSVNPTWTSGSNKQIIPALYDDPRAYISSIGLYDGTVSTNWENGVTGATNLLAIAKLSRPIPKASDTEALIKVRLDYVWYLALSIPFINEALRLFFS